MFQKLKNMPIETVATSLRGCNLIPGLLFNWRISTVVGYYFFMIFLVRIIFIYVIIMYFFMLMLLIYRLTTRPFLCPLSILKQYY